jgi:hypothetical protein
MIYHGADSGFAQKLSADLTQNGVEHARADTNTDERFSALHKADKVVVILSETAVSDARILATIRAAHEINTPIIPIRITNLPEMPKYLRGQVPLDFSNQNYYVDSFKALLEDIHPPVRSQTDEAMSALPLSIQEVLLGMDEAPSSERREIVELLGQFRESDDAQARSAAQSVLRDIVFKDRDTTIKHLAGLTLQSFEEERTTHLAITRPEPDERVAQIAEKIEKAPSNPLVTEAQTTPGIISGPLAFPVWRSPRWIPYLGTLGALLGATTIILIGNWSLGLALAMVYGGLAWFNVKIRENGQFVWDMPGPLVGNAGVGLGLGLVGAGIGVLLDDHTVWSIVGIGLFGAIHGVFIGWVSTLHTPPHKP